MDAAKFWITEVCCARVFIIARHLGGCANTSSIVTDIVDSAEIVIITGIGVEFVSAFSMFANICRARVVVIAVDINTNTGSIVASIVAST